MSVSPSKIVRTTSGRTVKVQPMEVDDDALDATMGQSTEPDSPKSDDEPQREPFDPNEVDMRKLRKCVKNLVDLLHMDTINFSKRIGRKKQITIMNELSTRLTEVLFKKAKIHYDAEQIVDQLKEKFDETTSADMKIKFFQFFRKTGVFRNSKMCSEK